VGALEINKVAYTRGVSGKNAPNAASGFTLIEILVVVVVIGIALALAIPNLFVSDEAAVRQESDRLVALLSLTRDEAVFSGYPIAVKLTERGISFLQRDPAQIETVWQEASREGLRPRAWREGIVVTLMADATSTNLALSENPTRNGESPTLTFLPAGVAAPFKLRVASTTSTAPAAITRVIEGDALGNITVSTVSP
jgi:general secretion pathway protein H